MQVRCSSCFCRAESADLVLMVADITELEFVEDPYQYMSSLFVELGLRTSADFAHISCDDKKDRGVPDVKAMFMDDAEDNNLNFHTRSDTVNRQSVQIIDNNLYSDCSNAHLGPDRQPETGISNSEIIEGANKPVKNSENSTSRSACSSSNNNQLLEAELVSNEKIPVILVLNKSDLIVNQGTYQRWQGFMSSVCQSCIVSCLTDDGMEEFLKILMEEVRKQ